MFLRCNKLLEKREHSMLRHASCFWIMLRLLNGTKGFYILKRRGVQNHLVEIIKCIYKDSWMCIAGDNSKIQMFEQRAETGIQLFSIITVFNVYTDDVLHEWKNCHFIITTSQITGDVYKRQIQAYLYINVGLYIQTLFAINIGYIYVDSSTGHSNT